MEFLYSIFSTGHIGAFDYPAASAISQRRGVFELNLILRSTGESHIAGQLPGLLVLPVTQRRLVAKLIQQSGGASG